MNPLEERLRKRIAEQGPIDIYDYMAEANAHYYATRDPLGVEGDFTTAPEISQMFGELAGVWLADLWERAGRPGNAYYVEPGPGRGTLAQDALRAMRGAGLEPSVELVETSPALRAAQMERLPQARWHERLETLPRDGPLLVVANEFLDALPIMQFDAAGEELTVGLTDGRFTRGGEVAAEASTAAVMWVRYLAWQITKQGGAALIVDYGHNHRSRSDTLQAVSRHAYADPFEAPGERDLTAHVDFSALVLAAGSRGARTYGPVGQGEWLEAMGLGLRAAALAEAAPERADEIFEARDRLAAPERMGQLFKVMALVAPGWPEPAGF